MFSILFLKSLTIVLDFWDLFFLSFVTEKWKVVEDLADVPLTVLEQEGILHRLKLERSFFRILRDFGRFNSTQLGFKTRRLQP